MAVCYSKLAVVCHNTQQLEKQTEIIQGLPVRYHCTGIITKLAKDNTRLTRSVGRLHWKCGMITLAHAQVSDHPKRGVLPEKTVRLPVIKGKLT